MDLVQAPLNLIDRRLITTGWLQRLSRSGVEIHTRSVFMQGLLLIPRETRPTQFSLWKALWEKWDNWLSNNDISAVQACLAYPLSFKEIDRIIVGADSVSQLAEIINEVGKKEQFKLPELQCEDECLINPSYWSAI